MWSGGSSRSRAMGRRCLRPVARYRSRCVRPSSTFAGCHGAGVSARGPTYVPPDASRLSRKVRQSSYLPFMIWPTRDRCRPTSSPISRSESPSLWAWANAFRRVRWAASDSRSNCFWATFTALRAALSFESSGIQGQPSPQVADKKTQHACVGDPSALLGSLD